MVGSAMATALMDAHDDVTRLMARGVRMHGMGTRPILATRFPGMLSACSDGDDGDDVTT